METSRSAPSILTTEHLSRSVGEVKLVEDINVQVRASEVLAVVGPVAGLLAGTKRKGY